MTNFRRAALAALAFGALAGAPAAALETSDVRDAAGLFHDADLVGRLRKQLREVESKTGVATVIETVVSIGAERPEEFVKQQAAKLKVRGIYVLIDKDDRKFEMVVTPPFNRAIGRAAMQSVRDAFLNEFRTGDFTAGLERGVEAIRTAVTEAEKSGGLKAAQAAPAAPATPSPSESNLILRNQAKLTLAGARLVTAGAEAKAAEMKLKMNIAVVDDGGHLLSFARMDGARPASGYTAITKATTAATFRQATGPLAGPAGPADPLLNLSLQNAAAASGGKVTTLYGGVPIEVDGQVIGAVGVGGGKGEQDAEVARAGIARYLRALGLPEPAPTAPATTPAR